MQQQPSRGGFNVEPPPGYVEQPLPESSWLMNFVSLPYADPMGYGLLLVATITLLYLSPRKWAKRLAVAVAVLLVTPPLVFFALVDPGGAILVGSAVLGTISVALIVFAVRVWLHKLTR
jgi:hypothetical protein